ncbi:2-phosphosulfolactate phosphatase [bacterium]|nr:2-phosphosulfolactate phosphatase [bacterium]
MSETKRTLEVLASPWGLSGSECEDRFCVVIDVLRATTTIAYALDAGARAVIPVESVEEALRLSQSLDEESTLVCGEQNSVRVEGFDLGNSPAEITPLGVNDKTLVLSTTNGARALAKLTGAKECVAAAFVNLAACARRAAPEQHITIVCAASGPSFSLEDFACAGNLVAEISRLAPGTHTLDDGARTALAVHDRREGSLEDFLAATDHGRFLESLGFAEDLALAARSDRFAVVPTLRGGRIVPEAEPVA